MLFTSRLVDCPSQKLRLCSSILVLVSYKPPLVDLIIGPGVALHKGSFGVQPDPSWVVVHRLIKSHAGGTPVTAKEMDEFDALARHCSEREVGATEAERDSIKMKQVEFLAGRIGETFDAVISGVTERGLYVEEQTTHADGMIRIKDVGDDYFEYDEKHYRLVGRRTKKAYQLGDPIRVKLIAARTPEKELDFVPA